MFGVYIFHTTRIFYSPPSRKSGIRFQQLHYPQVESQERECRTHMSTVEAGLNVHSLLLEGIVGILKMSISICCSASWHASQALPLP